MHRAKTIDLCQNPLTVSVITRTGSEDGALIPLQKEPKLQRARKIPEWEEYDAEVARLTRHLTEAGLLRSSSIANDVNALAGEAPATHSKADVAESQDEGDHTAEVENFVTHEEL